MNDGKREYEVGYGKPPTSTQFRKGRSGNPKGRPKGSKSIESLLAEHSSKLVPIKEGNRTRFIPMKEATVMNLIMSAAKGDRHSRKEYLEIIARIEAKEESEENAVTPHERDQVVLDGLTRQILMASKALPDETEEDPAEISPEETK